MRSTVRIDDDLMMALKEEARRRKMSLTRMLNRVLRAGLAATRQKPGPHPPFRQRTADMGEPRVDLDRALTVAAEMEDETTLTELALRK